MEALIGVVIGCVIGNVVAITILVVEHRRWKKEFKLQYLITERKRREEQFDRIRKLLVDGLIDDTFPCEFAISIGSRLPIKIAKLIYKTMKDGDLSHLEGKQEILQEISLILGAYLREIDKQIEELSQ